MNTDTVQVTFWGTRGSCPASHTNFFVHGCNTSCVSIELGETKLIIDAGTGIKNLGDSAFIKEDKTINILLSHFHLDHTLGLPFFEKMFDKDAIINIYARPLIYDNLYELMNSYFRPPFFPTEFMGKHSAADIRFNDLAESGLLHFQNDVKVEYCSVPHAEGSTSFKVILRDKSVCYMSDLELGPSLTEFDENLLAFARNTELLILDTFFIGKDVIPGWGHSSWEQGINFAKQADVKKAAMFHHNISSTDAMLDACYEKYKDWFPGIVVAKDGLDIYI